MFLEYVLLRTVCLWEFCGLKAYLTFDSLG